MKYKPVMSLEEVSAYMKTVFPQAEELRWSIAKLGDSTMTVNMSIDQSHLRPGNTISGPTMFALADVAAYMVILAHIGEVPLAVTTSLNINFMAKPELGDLYADTRLIKLGKRLAVCEIHIFSSVNHDMVAQATATYSIPLK